MMIESVNSFESIVEEIRELLSLREGEEWPEADLPLRVPSGPIERW